MSRSFLLSSLLALGLLLPAGHAASQTRADTLLIDRAEAGKDMSGPMRGASMSQVEAQYGAPDQKLEPRGGQQPQWPVIHRWVYPQFTVYFEKSHVIDVVLRQATPGEIGPKPTE